MWTISEKEKKQYGKRTHAVTLYIKTAPGGEADVFNFKRVWGQWLEERTRQQKVNYRTQFADKRNTKTSCEKTGG